MDDLIGVWTLDGFSAEREGEVTHPLGEHPGGMLVYTADGWVSALLVPEGHGDRPVQEPATTAAYAGRWERSGDTVLHHVGLSLHAPWVGTILRRDVRLASETELELTTTSTSGAHWSLRWRRATA
ncbi:lipocalin-like domain-containing protein [Streptomyces sp. NPDC015492]|uniref:lipocalin-like domain-containing protein n=1 Tax=Streptomyces sp. NPDC015492 TaxID=3364958 RepID=UPI0036FFD2BD